MTLLRATTVAFLLAGLAGAAEPASAQGVVKAVNVNRLPISVTRIQHELRQSTTSEAREGINLRYEIQVYGQSPDIKLFTKEDNLTNGPVPYGAPTHQDFIQQLTPKEFSSPVMDFNSLFKWLADKAK